MNRVSVKTQSDIFISAKYVQNIKNSRFNHCYSASNEYRSKLLGQM